MKNPICAPSYERAVELLALDCSLDYLDALPHRSVPMRHSFQAEQLPGYVESRVYALGPLNTGWVIPLRLSTDRPSGTIIRYSGFQPPRKDHVIDWECKPEDIILKKHWDEYSRLVNSPIMKVLNGGCRIRCGYPVEGVLCGRSVRPHGEAFHGFISAELVFTDNRENTVALCINLNVYRHRYSSDNLLLGGVAGRRPTRHRLRNWLTQQAPISGPERESGMPPDFAGFSRDRDSDRAFS